MLYMFQAVLPPIIRNSKLYSQHLVFIRLFLLVTTIVSWNDSGKKQEKPDEYQMLGVQF
jgi:hypothetical protein